MSTVTDCIVPHGLPLPDHHFLLGVQEQPWLLALCLERTEGDHRETAYTCVPGVNWPPSMQNLVSCKSSAGCDQRGSYKERAPQSEP